MSFSLFPSLSFFCPQLYKLCKGRHEIEERASVETSYMSETEYINDMWE